MRGRTDQHSRHGTSTEAAGELLRAPAGYPITEKMRWRTPGWLYGQLNEEFGFDLDACAEDGCAQAPRWLTHEEDALAVDWRTTFRVRQNESVRTIVLQEGESSPIRTAYQNPPWAPKHVSTWVRELHPDVAWKPFPGTDRFLARAWEMSRLGVVVASLIPQAFDTEWIKPLIVLADEVRVGRRFHFLRSDGLPDPQRSQPPGGHALVVYRPHVPINGWPGGPRTNWDWAPRR